MFPMTAVTSDHKFSGSQRHKLIALELWRSHVQDGSYWAESKVNEAALPGASGENKFPCLFLLLEAAPISLAPGPFLRR